MKTMVPVASSDDEQEKHLATRRGGQTILTSRRFHLLSTLVVAALLPFLLRMPAAPVGHAPALTNALIANALAVIIAFWIRLSVEVYPGIRRSYVIVPTVLVGHGIAFALLLATRLPYGRVSLTLGILFHIGWLYLLYVAVERKSRRRIAVVPAGGVEIVRSIPNVEWQWLKRPRLADASNCNAIVADFSAELPGEWAAFLAEAAIAGRIVYQHKQLAESLTGRIQLEHLSENTFGSLVPSRGYFYVKGLLDFLLAILLLPIALPVMALIAARIWLEDGGPIFFRQKRVGQGGREFVVYKFRTMRSAEISDPRTKATTLPNDGRITPLGRQLRKYRLDELPQIVNILKWEMSWIGPRPEARDLSTWYKVEIPFYVYRHVVKPGITGWAQVNQGHVADIDGVHQKLQYDFYYIKNFSPWLDLLILLRTIRTMVTGFGHR